MSLACLGLAAVADGRVLLSAVKRGIFEMETLHCG